MGMTDRALSAASVDGFNLYLGLEVKGWKHLCWFDVGRPGEHGARPAS